MAADTSVALAATMGDAPARDAAHRAHARQVCVVDTGRGFVEPKWDGFRTIVFRDGDEVELGSRNERPMTRYFPEVVAAVKANVPGRCVIDGRSSLCGATAWTSTRFSSASIRLPPESTCSLKKRRHRSSPSICSRSTMSRSWTRRSPSGGPPGGGAAERPLPVHVTPATRDLETAHRWFEVFEGAGLDEVVAKPADAPYSQTSGPCSRSSTSGQPTASLPAFGGTKAARSSAPPSGPLQRQRGAAARRRVRLVPDAAAGRAGRGACSLPDGRPGGTSVAGVGRGGGPRGGACLVRCRDGMRRDLSWLPLRPELVVEVAYDHMEGDRFRHTAQFRRWRRIGSRHPAHTLNSSSRCSSTLPRC